MKYLLDTNVVSALRRPDKNPQVAQWAHNIPQTDCYISSLTVAEIGRGIRAIAKRDIQQAQILSRWFEHDLLPTFDGRILSFDLAASLRFNTFEVPEKAPIDDAYIAAIADAHHLLLVSRNEKHVKPLRVPVLNPWES